MTLIKMANPMDGVTHEQFEAICRALGIKPEPPRTGEGSETGVGTAKVASSVNPVTRTRVNPPGTNRHAFEVKECLRRD